MRDVMLFFHFLGLAMGIGTSFAFMFLGMASAKMDAAESQKFRLNSFAISRMGHIGLTLLVISGGYLMTPYWKSLSTAPLLITKLVLVVALGALIGIISSKAKKAKSGDTEMHLKSIENLGKITLLIGLAILILAVSIFH